MKAFTAVLVLLVCWGSDGFSAVVEQDELPESQPPRRLSSLPECTSNDDCPVDRMCVSQKCTNPCLTVCGDNTVCQMTKHTPVCMCNPGYIGNPVEGCQKPDCPCSSNRTGVDTEVKKKKTYVFERKWKNWFEALQYCHSQNRRLATVTSKEENDEITNLIAQLGIVENVGLWIGGTDVVKEGDWMWMSTGQPIQGYTNWYVGANQKLDSDQNCLLYIKHGNNTKWGDYRCSFNTTFICEY